MPIVGTDKDKLVHYSTYGMSQDQAKMHLQASNNVASSKASTEVILKYDSKLYELHVKGRVTKPFVTDFGRIISPSRFTRPFLPLADYHAQVFDDTGIFGIRNDNLDSDKQPYVIRGIGQRWGKGNIELPDSIGINNPKINFFVL